MNWFTSWSRRDKLRAIRTQTLCVCICLWGGCYLHNFLIDQPELLFSTSPLKCFHHLSSPAKPSSKAKPIPARAAQIESAKSARRPQTTSSEHFLWRATWVSERGSGKQDVLKSLWILIRSCLPLIYSSITVSIVTIKSTFSYLSELYLRDDLILPYSLSPLPLPPKGA